MKWYLNEGKQGASEKAYFYSIFFLQCFFFSFLLLDPEFILTIKSDEDFSHRNGLDLISVNRDLLSIALIFLAITVINGIFSTRNFSGALMHFLAFSFAFKLYKVQLGPLNVSELDILFILISFLLLGLNKFKVKNISVFVAPAIFLCSIWLMLGVIYSEDISIALSSLVYMIFPFFALMIFTYAGEKDVFSILSSFYLGDFFFITCRDAVA